MMKVSLFSETLIFFIKLLIFIMSFLCTFPHFLDTSNEDIPTPPPQIPEQARADLILIANWLLDKGQDEYLKEYGKVRGSVLQKSMTLLRNHQRSVSGGSVHGATGSPMLVIYSVFKTNFILALISLLFLAVEISKQTRSRQKTLNQAIAPSV